MLENHLAAGNPVYPRLSIDLPLCDVQAIVAALQVYQTQVQQARKDALASAEEVDYFQIARDMTRADVLLQALCPWAEAASDQWRAALEAKADEDRARFLSQQRRIAILDTTPTEN
jgi:hypothetical protein